MCTSIKYKNNYFGRNLDLEFDLPQTKIVLTPKGYKLNKKENNQKIKINHAIIGMAMVVNDYPLYYDGMNEKGLFMSGLYFNGYAKYFKKRSDLINISPFEFIPYVLGMHSSVKEIKRKLKNVNLIDIPFSKEIPLTPMHWMIADDKDCIVVESTIDGMKIYDNPYKTLTNNPSFNFHMENINNYTNLSPIVRDKLFNENIKVISNGSGTQGIPGGLSSQDRFIRATYTNLTSVSDDLENDDLIQHMHILDSVAQTRGSVVASHNRFEITIYSNCYSSKTMSLYYKTYQNSRINGISLKNNKNLKSKKLTIYEINRKTDINWIDK